MTLRRRLGNRAPWLRGVYWSVRRACRSALSAALAPHFPHEATYEGIGGKAWCVGFELRARSIAAYFCGDDLRSTARGRVWWRRVPGRITETAAAGGLPIVQLLEPDPWPADVLRRAIVVPQLVSINADLPADADALRAQLLTSTTRGDFRRIRHANFSYRITSDPAAIREFAARHQAPMIAHRFPEDGRVAPVENMLDKLGQGGELVCAHIDDEWVAGVFNVANEASYDLGGLGIRDADETVRRQGVVAALIVRSLERAVELGHRRATLGQSLPFLGKGSVWFKAKWGGMIARDTAVPELHMFMDLRLPAVRRMLSANPVIHVEGKALVATTWLRRGDKSAKDTARDEGRFAGISRWYVLGEQQTLAAAEAHLSASERIVPVPVTLRDDRPLWLGETLPGPAVS
jgi:Acetyltransferase (GNAT) domain